MMDHYKGINPDERWRNDLLNELRKLNDRLSAPQAAAPEKAAQEARTRTRKPKEAQKEG